MLLFDVTRDFELCCDQLLKEKRIEREFIRNHERKVIVLQNLCHQMQIYEQRFKGRVDPKSRRTMIAGTAQMFIKAALKERKEHYYTEAKKHEADKVIQAREEMREVLVEVDGSTKNPN